VSGLRSSWPWAVVAAAAALAFVGGIGAGLAPQPPPAPRSPSPAPSLSPSSTVGGRHLPPEDLLAGLTRPQQPVDVPRIPIGQRLIRSTFRVIDSSVLSNIYVARDVDGRICVVAIPIDDQFAATCGPDRKGLHTPLLLLYTVIPPGEGPVGALAGVDATG
jgi:hypothetical protein